MADRFKIGEGYVGIETDDDTDSGLARIKAKIDAWSLRAAEKIKITVDVDTDAAAARVRSFAEGLSGLIDRGKDVVLGMGRAVSSVAAFTSILGPVTNGVVGATVATGAWLGSLVPLLGLLPGLAASLTTIGLVAKAVLPSIGESLYPITDAFTELGNRLGDIAQKGLSDFAQGFVDANLPAIEAGTSRIAQAFNDVTRYTLEWTATAQGQQAVANIVDAAASAAERLSPSISALVISFGNFIARVGDPAIGALADFFGDLLDRTNGWIDRLTAADIQNAFNNLRDAAEGFREKLSAARDVVQWLGDHQGMITAVSDALAGIGLVIGAITFNWVAVVVAATTLILNHFGDIVDATAGVRDGLADLWSKIANDPNVQQIITNIGQIVDAIQGDFATGLEWLGQKWEELTPHIERAWQFLGPLVNDILANPTVQEGIRTWAAALVIAAGALLAIAGAAAVVSAAVGGAVVAMQAWLTGTLVDGFVDAYQAVVEFLTGIRDTAVETWQTIRDRTTEAFEAIAGFVESIPGRLEAAWSGIVEGARAAWEGFTGWLQGIADSIGDMWDTATERLRQAWDAAVEYLSTLPGRILGYVEEFVVSIPERVGYMAGLVVGAFILMAAGIIEALVSFPGVVLDLFTQAKNWAVEQVTDMSNQVIQWFSELPGRAYDAAVTLIDRATEIFTRTKDAAVELTVGLLTEVTLELATLPGRAYDAIVAWIERATDVFTRAKDAAIEQTVALLTSVTLELATLPGRAYSAIVDLISQVAQVFTTAKDRALAIAGQLVDQAVAKVSTLPGRARSALGDLSGVLVSAGRSLLQGFINGVEAMIGPLESALSRVTALIPDWKGPEEKDRVLLEPAGRLVMQGFMRGIDRERTALRDQLRDITGMVGDVAVGTAGIGTSLARTGGGTVYRFEAGAITLDASKVKSLGDLVAMIEGVTTTSRQYATA